MRDDLQKRLLEPVLASRSSMAGGVPSTVTSYQIDPLHLEASQAIDELLSTLTELVAAIEAGAFEPGAPGNFAALGKSYLAAATAIIGRKALS